MLQDDDKEKLLDGLLECSISFDEAEEISGKQKALSAAKTALLEGVNIETWEVAERVIPNFANEDVLSKFQLQKGKPVPRTFKVCGYKKSHIRSSMFFCTACALCRPCVRGLRLPCLVIPQ